MPLSDVPDISPPVDFNTARKYLTDRAIPSDDDTLDKCHLVLRGTTEGYTLIDKGAIIGDTRIAIAVHYPDTDPPYYAVRWVGRPPVKGLPKIEVRWGMPVPCFVPDFIDWNECGSTLYICESPFKALVLALRGYAAVASNGVWSMWRKDKRTKNHDYGWADGFPIPQMDLIEKIVILFDSDIQTKADLMLSVLRLGDQLQTLYPNKSVMERPLPPADDGSVVGIDDVVAAKGDKWLHEWLADDSKEQLVEMGELHRHFGELNEEYCVIREKGFVMHKESGSALSFSKFEKVEGNRTVPAMRKDAEPKSAAKKWEAWETRSDADRVMYIPGKEMMCMDGSKRIYNIWEDDGVASREGDIAPFLTVYENAIPDQEVRELLLHSIAWMLQNRGVKLNKLFFFIGTMGTGKSLLANVLKSCFGRRNATSISDLDLIGQFNAHYAAKEFVVLDDLHKLGKPIMAKIKKLVTDDTIIVNGKMAPHFEIDNYIVFFVTSNEIKGLPLMAGDRRVLVIDAQPLVFYPDGHQHWHDFIAWRDSGGREFLRYWFEHLDLSEYSPNFMPPVTETKAHIIEASLSAEQQWAKDLEDFAETMLPSPRRVYTLTELYEIYTGGQESSQSKSYHLGEALKELYHQVTSPSGKVAQIRTGGGNPARYWMIGDKVSVAEAREQIEKWPYALKKY